MAPEKEKITVMILYVDLKCPCCYKKVRKLLCKFPQIRDQVFDVDKNKVIITVVCCDPEKLRDKLCCKGGGVIQSIEIVKNKPPLEKRICPPSPNGSPKDTPHTKLEKKPSEELKSPPPESEKTEPDPPVSACCQECYEGRDGGPCHHGYGRPVPPQVPEKCKPCPPKSADPPRPTCCQECYEGRDGGPCHHRYGRPVPPQVPEKCKPCPPKSAYPPRPTCCQECYEGRDGGPCHHGYGRPVPTPVPEKCKPYPSIYADPPEPTPTPPVSACCQECNEGRGGGPCHYGYGRPVPPSPCYYYSGYLYPSNRPCYVSRCDSFSEDNPQGCSIM